MLIFKLNSFPQISETFIVTNIVYAIRRKIDVKILCKTFLGLKKSSQKDLILNNNILNVIQKPMVFSRSTVLRYFQYTFICLNPRIFICAIKNNLFFSKVGLRTIIQLYNNRLIFKPSIWHVHFNNALTDVLAFQDLNIIKSKFVITFHGYDAFLDTPKDFWNTYGLFYERYVERVTVNSNYLKSIVSSLGVKASMIDVVPIGVDPQLFNGTKKHLKKNYKISLLSVGRLVQLKGHKYGIHCVNCLKKGGFDVEYLIVGAGEEQNRLSCQIRELGLENEVKLLGAKNQVEIKEIMREADVFLMTSTFDENTFREEAFGLVSIEAQAMGLPVVGFNTGGFSETIIDSENGFLVNDRDYIAMAQKVEFLIENPEVYTSFSERSLNNALDYNLDNTYSEYLKIYNNVMKQF